MTIRAPVTATRLMNGAKFEFTRWSAWGDINGRYLDYTGEWWVGIWDIKGVFYTGAYRRIESEDMLNIDWSTAP